MKFKFFIFCFLLLQAEAGWALQDSLFIDSLEKALSHAPEDTTRLKILNLLVESLTDDEVWPAYNTAMGELARKLSQTTDSTVHRTAKIYEAASLNNEAVIRFYKGDVPNAVRLHHESLRIREEINDLRGVSESLNNIGYALLQQGETKKAILFYKRSLAIEEETGDSTGTALSLNNIGLAHNAQGRYQEAIRWYEKSLAIRTALDDKLSMATTLNNMGITYGHLSESDRSIDCFQRSFALSETIGNKRGMAQSLTELANAFLNQGNTDRAYPLALQAHELALKTGYPVRIKATAQLLKKIYKERGKSTEALSMFELEIQMRDSMQNEETRKAILQQQYQYDYERKEAAMQAEQDKKAAVLQQRLLRQRVVIYSSVAVVVLLLLLVVAIVNRNRTRQRANGKLKEAYDSLKAAQLQLVQKEKLASLGQLTASIAHEIKNPLNFVNNFSELSRDILEEYRSSSSDSEKALLLGELETNLSKITSHGKRADSIVRGMLLHSRTEAGQKAPADLKELCESALGLAHHGFRSRIPDFHCDIEKHYDSSLPQVKIIHQDIARVVLNLLNNAFYAVHRRSEEEKLRDGSQYQPKISLAVSTAGHNVSLRIRDNGTGIPPAAREKIFEPFYTTKSAGEGTGLGLSICYDIVKAHHGDIFVDSRENDFTEFVIVLPVGN